MASIIDERGFNQGFVVNQAQVIRLRRRAGLIAEEVSKSPSDMRTILELGCGTGELAAELAKLTGSRVTGVDISPGFINRARQMHQLPQLDFMVADLTRELPSMPDHRYDYIIGNGILHHLYHNLDDVLPRLALWLNPGGRLIFWEPNYLNPYIYLIFTCPALRKWARLEPDEMAFTHHFIKRKLLACGYSKANVLLLDFLFPNTPNYLIKPVIALGRILEAIPLARALAQSIFISASISPSPPKA